MIFIVIFVFLIRSSAPAEMYRFFDEWVYYFVAKTWAHGGMPYLKMWDHKGPLLYVFWLLPMLSKHHAVMRYVTPEEFSGYEKVAYTKGFLMVSASPLTRSSHHAGDDFARLRTARAAKSR